MTSQFDRDVDYMKERLQDRYGSRLGVVSSKERKARCYSAFL